MSESVPRFDQTRKEWATSRDALADRCYCEYFDVSPSDLYDLESLVDDVHDRDAGYRTHQILDYGGVDRIVDCGDRHVYVAQRFRPNTRGRRDLSLRTSTGVEGRYPELVKWRTAYRTLGFYPSVIAFGVYDSVLDVFSRFYLIDTERVLAALDDGLRYDEYTNADGTAAMYVPVDELRRRGCILREWDGVRP